MNNELLQDPHSPHKIQVTLGVMLVLFALFFGAGKEELAVHKTTPIHKGTINPYKVISLEAQSAIVFDINTGRILYRQHETDQLPLASLAKLLTAIVATENIDADESVIITKSAIAKEGDSGFLTGELWNPSDLIALTLITSSNDGAVALAEAVSLLGKKEDINAQDIFSYKILETIQRANLDQTYLLDPSGLDISSEISGAYGSAYDVAKLFAYIMEHHPQILEETTHKEKTLTSLSNYVHSATNTNELVNTLPAVIGSKTGFTYLAGGNLAVAFDAGLARPMVVVVLGSSREGRFSDVAQLIWATFEYLEYTEQDK
ncbi:MAG: hypothetical protein WD003_00700 [Candidatus Paceibacterota bacterium]